MKITFLGTSHGLSEKDRYRTSIMVEVKEKLYIIDGGAPVYDLLVRRGKNLTDITAVFATHAHGDHVLGLLPLLEVSSWSDKNVSYDVYLTDQKLKDAFVNTLEITTDLPFDLNRLRLTVYDENTIYDDGDVKVSFDKNYHYLDGKPSYTITFTADGKTVVFSGDVSSRLSKGDFPKLPMDKPAEMLVMELAHLTFEDAVTYLQNANVKKVCFNHVFRKSNFDSIENNKNNFPFEVYAVNDNDEFII